MATNLKSKANRNLGHGGLYKPDSLDKYVESSAFTTEGEKRCCDGLGGKYLGSKFL